MVINFKGMLGWLIHHVSGFVGFSLSYESVSDAAL